MSSLTPEAWTAIIVSVATSLSAIVTAIHAHGKSTSATDTANTSQALAKNVTEIGTALIGLLGAFRGSNTPAVPVVVNTHPGEAPTTVFPAVQPQVSNAEEVLGSLIQWLAQQHKATVGSNPSATTDYSKALLEIQRLGGNA